MQVLPNAGARMTPRCVDLSFDLQGGSSIIAACRDFLSLNKPQVALHSRKSSTAARPPNPSPYAARRRLRSSSRSYFSLIYSSGAGALELLAAEGAICLVSAMFGVDELSRTDERARPDQVSLFLAFKEACLRKLQH